MILKLGRYSWLSNLLSYFKPRHKTMILVKTDKDGEVTELRSEGTFTELSRVVKSLIKEYESNGLMLIKDKAYGISGRVTEFATEENGWECGIMIASGWVKLARPPKEDDDEND